MRNGSRLGRAWPTLFAVCVIGATFPLLAGSSAADTPAEPCALDSESGVTTCTFASTGAEQTFTVPAGVTSLHVAAVGGLGGSYYSAYASGPGSGNASGASVSADLPVIPGALLYVEVGGNGGDTTYFNNNGPGGFNGGANGGTGTFDGTTAGNSLAGAGGGGASDVRTSPRSSALNPDPRLLVAAGGGGAAANTGLYDFFGAAGFGGAAGTAGNNGYGGGGGGGAGTSSGGGVGGAGYPDNAALGESGADGTLGGGGAGGRAPFPRTNAGGGGGGGLYGGGGGGSNQTGGGGGGGSSYSSGSNVVIAGAGGTGPSIVISYTAPPAYTVQFDANGGAGSMADEVQNAASALTTNAFTRAGYDFTGWNTAANGSGTAYADGASYAFSADATLYAQWVVGDVVPGAPTAVGASAGNAQATVTFEAPTSDGGSTILDYTATCGSKSTTGAASPLVVTGLTNGATVPCSVTARNIVGSGPASTPAAAVKPVTVPGVPTSVTALAGNAQATVKFAKPLINGGSGILDYTATCGSKSTTGSGSPLVVTGLTNGATVPCAVTARNAAGTSPASASIAVKPATAPGAPQNVSAIPGNAQATVKFAKPLSNGGRAITSYTATCGSKSKAGAGSPLVVTGLANGITVSCTVKATNAVGTGPAATPPVAVKPRS